MQVLLASLYTNVVLFCFSFFSNTSASAEGEKEKIKNVRLLSSSLAPTTVRRRSINPLRFFFLILGCALDGP